MGRLVFYCLMAVSMLPGAACLDAGNIDKRPFSLQLELGGLQPALNDSAQIWTFRAHLAGGLQYMLSEKVGVVFSAMMSRTYDDTIGASVFQADRSNAGRKWLIKSVSLGPKIYLRKRGGLTPYLLASIDVLRWRIVQLPGESYVRVADGSGALTDYEATELGATLGLGVEKLLWDMVGVGASFYFSYLSGAGADFAGWVDDSRSRALLRLAAKLSLNVGFSERSSGQQSSPDVDVGEVDDGNADTLFGGQSGVRRGESSLTPSKPGSAETDEDLDGVADSLDRCPATPAGAVVDIHGCPNDADGDGVYDGIDRCPETAKEARNTVDYSGCPRDQDFDGVPDYIDLCPDTPPQLEVDSFGCILDRDHDGVADQDDLCLGTPEWVQVDSRGCPDFERIFAKRVIGSLFRPGGTAVLADQKVVLDSVVWMLLTFPKVTAVVKGYTDDIGPAAANLEVSAKRAHAVMGYLISQGVGASRLKAVGLGETDFVASNRTRSGREQNRRVEIEFSYTEPDQ